MYGSFLAFLPGIAGAYGGAVVRRVMDNLRQGKYEPGFGLRTPETAQSPGFEAPRAEGCV